MTVLDSSAILCWLQDERGADIVEQALATEDCRCGIANWSEVVQKVAAVDGDWRAAKSLLAGSGLLLAPVTAEDGEVAALLWLEQPHLSLADRLCLALGRRLGEPVLTADRVWGESDGVRQVRP